MSDDLEPPDPPEREHDCCDECGRGSCPGSGSRGADACTYWYVRGREGVEQSPSSAAVGSDPDPTAGTNPAAQTPEWCQVDDGLGIVCAAPTPCRTHDIGRARGGAA